MTMPYESQGLGQATMVSAPGGPNVGGVSSTSAAPGATGPGAGMSVSNAILFVIGGAAAALVAIGVVFRRPIGQT